MSETPPLTGTTIGDRYRLGRILGEGRTGRVYSALDKTERRKVAVKALHPVLCQVEEQVKRFEREFSATRDLVHPNVCRTWDLICESGRYYLVMELLDGKLLSDQIEKKKQLGLERSLELARMVTEGLGAAHDAGLIHRDLSSSNIMLLKDGGIKILDFGVARLTGGGEDLTAVGVRLGSATYMSPEYVSDGDVDHRSDFYSLGVLLFEMLCGQPPFIGPPLKVMDDHVSAPPRSPSDRAAGIPPFVNEIVLGLLAKNPVDRPSSATEVVEMIWEASELIAADDRWGESILTGGAVLSDSIPPSGMGGGFGVLPDAAASGQEMADAVFHPTSKRRQAMLIAVAVGGALLGAVTAGVVVAWLIT